MYLKNQADMNGKAGNETYGAYITAAQTLARNNTDEALSLAMNDLNTVKDEIGQGTDIDSIAVLAAAIAMESKDYKDIVAKYRKAQSDIGGSQNVALIWTAMVSSVDIVKMYIEGTLAQWIASQQSAQQGGSGGNSTSATIPKPKNTIEQVTIKETNLVMQGTAQSIGTITDIVIHHLGGGFDASADSIHQDHLTNPKFDGRGIGYHYVIRWDGTIERGRPENELGCHCGVENGKGGNKGRIGINVSGTWLDNGTVINGKVVPNGGHPNPSDEQIKSLIRLIADCCKRHNLTPSRDNIWGHYEVYDGRGNGEGCPGTNLMKRLDDIVQSVAGGTYGNTREDILWTEFINLIIEGCKLKGTINIENIGLFPKICFLYVNLMNAAKTSSIDGDAADGGWAFPFKDDQIRNFPGGPFVYLTGLYGEDRGDHKHEGIDLQPAGTADRFDLNIDIYAMKAGTVYTQGQWCNGVYILHNDGTYSRYLHLKQILVKHGQQVQQGESIGYVGGHDGYSNTAYAYHLHVEAGRSISSKISKERSFGEDNVGIDLCEKWKPTNGTEGGYKIWRIS